jgi:CIC family chloride channel protein
MKNNDDVTLTSSGPSISAVRPPKDVELERPLAWMFGASVVIGVLSAFGAYGFRLLIGVIHNLAFLGKWSPFYDANMHTPESPLGWLLIFVPVIGSVVVIWLVRNFAPEAKGHGVPEVIDAIHYGQGKIKGQVSLVKALASATTVGTGGALGREGPIVQIGAAMSSGLASLFRLPPHQRIVLLSCGASAGIAATFNAPLAGVLFSIELLLVNVNSRSLMLVAVATVLSAHIGRLLIGPNPAFMIPQLVGPTQEVASPLSLLWFFPLGAILGVVGLLIIRTLYGTHDLFERTIPNEYLRHAVGALMLGILIVAMYKMFGHYYIQGVSYATITDILKGALTDPWFLLLLLGLKLVATSLTLGSGGSGGVFSPLLFFGVTLGGAFGGLLSLAFPGMGIDPMAFALAGMAAMVAAATSAPLTAAVITYEMTLDYDVILPVMISVGIAYAVRYSLSKVDIYTIKLRRRGHIIPMGLSTDIHGSFTAHDIMSTDFRLLEQTSIFSPSNEISVIVNEGNVVGLVPPFPYAIDFDVPVDELICTDFVTLSPSTSLAQALRRMSRYHCKVALVCARGPNTDPNEVVGVLRHEDIIRLLCESAELHNS